MAPAYRICAVVCAVGATDFLAESKARSVGADSDVPVFAFGYSFGGLLAVAAMLDDPHCCDGAVLHSPLVDVAPESNVHPAVVMSAKVRVTRCVK